MALNDLDQNSRFEKSLGLLTTRFVNLLQDAEDGVLDLKVVSVIFIFRLVCPKKINTKTCRLHFSFPPRPQTS